MVHLSGLSEPGELAMSRRVGQRVVAVIDCNAEPLLLWISAIGSDYRHTLV